ncbi:MAG: hypothetical protein CVV00_03695 [Firmicutes bacterium HGW-Firmicutes-5]|nr:MAG: hypothetical protein CVV00_03695 [Firmicutes bacterium HGW-Firmicutes-5]
MSAKLEHKLIKNAVNGDSKAFEKLILPYEKKVYNIAMQMFKNEQDAYDAAQEVLIKVYNNLDKFKFESAFSTWLHRLAMNTCIDEYRKRKRHLEHTTTMEVKVGLDDESITRQFVDHSLTPEQEALQNETVMEVRNAMDQLKEDQKLPVKASKIMKGGEMMECIKAREWIHQHMDKSLDHSNEVLLMAHIEDCDVCRKDYEILMSIHQVLQSTDEVDLPSDFHERLMKKIERPKKRQNIVFLKQLNIAAVIVFVLVFSLIGLNNLNQEKNMSNDEVSEEMLSMSALSDDSGDVGVAMEATESEDASLSRASNENERSQKATSDSLLQEVDHLYGNDLFGVPYDKGWVIVMVGGILILGLLIGYIKLKF